MLTGLLLMIIVPIGINLTRDTSDSSSLNLPPMPEDKADRFVQIASQSYFFHEYPKAIENYENAIKVYETRGETRRVAKTHQSIGDVYKILGQYDSAEKEYLISADHHSEIGNLAGKAEAYKKIGSMHSELGERSRALDWYLQSLKAVESGPPSMILGQILETIGRFYWEKKQASEAIEHLLRAKETFVAIRFHMGTEHMTNLIDLIQGSHYSAKGNPSKKKL